MEHEDQPVKGVMIYLLYTVFYTCNFVIANLLYDRNPNLYSFQMLIVRSCFVLFFQALYVNKDLKKAVCDSVKPKDLPVLGFRSLQGSISNIINFSISQYLPMTIIGIFNNLGPLIAIILAYLILKEKIAKWTIFMMFLTVSGVLFVVLTSNEDSGSETQKQAHGTGLVIVYVLLLFNPILGAGGTIIMRKMKKFHDATVSFYLSWSIITVNLIIVLATGIGFKAVYDFDYVSWLLIAGTGLTTLLA